MLSSVKVKQWLSPLVAVLFAAIGATGILMSLELRVPGIQSFHEVAGITFAVAGLAHLVSNWKALVAYFRKPKGWVTLVAAALACVTLLLAGMAGRGDREFGPERRGHDRHERTAGESGMSRLG